MKIKNHAPQVLSFLDHPKVAYMDHNSNEWNGTRVFFWAADAQLRYGIVLDTTRFSDGTQVLKIKPDNGDPVSLPAAGVTIVYPTPPQNV